PRPIPSSDDEKPILPHEKLMLVDFHDPDEAYFLCGLLTSTLVRFFVENQMVNTQIAPHVISQLRIPRFNRSNDVHLEISKLCYKGNKKQEVLENAVDAIDQLTSKIFDVDMEEIKEIREARQKIKEVMAPIPRCK